MLAILITTFLNFAVPITEAWVFTVNLSNDIRQHLIGIWIFTDIVWCGRTENKEHNGSLCVVHELVCADGAGRKRDEIAFGNFYIAAWGFERAGTFHDVAHLLAEIVKMHRETHLTGLETDHTISQILAADKRVNIFILKVVRVRCIFILPRDFINMEAVDIDIASRLEAVNKVLTRIFEDSVSITDENGIETEC